MPRISKVEKARREQREVRAEKAIDSLTDQFRKILKKHSGNLFKPETEISAQMGMTISTDGNGTLRFEYQTRVVDGAFFPLDDGQDDLPLNNPAPSKAVPAKAVPATVPDAVGLPEAVSLPEAK